MCRQLWRVGGVQLILPPLQAGEARPEEAPARPAEREQVRLHVQCLRDAGRRKDRLRQQRLSPRGVCFADGSVRSSWPSCLRTAIPSRLTPMSHRARRTTMVTRLLSILAALTVLAGCASAPPAPAAITTETFMLPAADPDIQLHVRNKRPAGQDRFAPERIVLFVHGATFPSETGFDIPLPGGSWMDPVAGRGFDGYAGDVRGYGRSTGPAPVE